MPKNKVNKSGKNARKPKRSSGASTTAHAVATHKDERVPAYAYDERVPIIADELRQRPQRSATVAELFESLESAQFRTPRRVAATFRADQRSDDPMFAHGETANTWTLRKRSRNGAGKPKSKISRKRTRAIA